MHLRWTSLTTSNSTDFRRTASLDTPTTLEIGSQLQGTRVRMSLTPPKKPAVGEASCVWNDAHVYPPSPTRQEWREGVLLLEKTYSRGRSVVAQSPLEVPARASRARARRPIRRRATCRVCMISAKMFMLLKGRCHANSASELQHCISHSRSGLIPGVVRRA